MKFEQGNALFLILIAVALFAALSYAVTNSGRGGSGIDKEQAEIMAAQMMQFVSRIQMASQRYQIIGGYDQLDFTENAADDNGTCFDGGAEITPCNTLGFFSDEVSLQPYWDDQLWSANYASDYQWQLLHITLEKGGLDYGTDKPDLVLNGIGINAEACKALNRQINDDATIGTLSIPTGNGYGYASLGAIRTSGLEAPAAVPASDIKYVVSQDGCVENSGLYYLVYLLKAN